MRRLRAAGRLPPDHAVDPERSARGAAPVRKGRFSPGRQEAPPQFRQGSRRRNVGSDAMNAAVALLWLISTSLAPAEPIVITVAARTIQPGELVVLTIATPRDAQHLRVRAFDRDVPVYNPETDQSSSDGRRRTWQALIGIDLDVAP